MKMLSAIMGLCVLVFAGQVEAKELLNRLGVGVKQNVSIGLSELATVYHFNPEMSLAGGLGIDTQKDYSRFSANVGLRRVVFKEDNMNFYMGGSVGLLNQEQAGSKESGFELNALFGGEFFFTGLDSLAFTFEGGIGIVSMDEVRFRTIGNGPFSAGIIFYF